MIELYLFLFWVYHALWHMHGHKYLAHQSVIYSRFLTNVVKTFRWLRSTQYNPDSFRKESALHIKHHATSDSVDDPHSPLYKNIWTGTMQITEAEINALTKNNKHVDPTAIDFFFQKYPIGLYIQTIILMLLFGWIGLVFSLFLKWYPVQYILGTAYISHVWPGYINVKRSKVDQSRNLPYCAIIMLGEEYHANHHAWPRRANNAVRWWELDSGYWLLRFLQIFKLVKIAKHAPITKPFDGKLIPSNTKIIDN